MLPFDIDNPTLALAAWSRICEPGDEDAGRLIKAGGPSAALHWLVEQGSQTTAGGKGVRHAVERWLPRLKDLDPRRELKTLASLGGRLLTPESPEWPSGLNDLGDGAPLCLWVWAAPQTDLANWWSRSISIVGARACTCYGQTVARSLASDLVGAGFTVVSGGAFGIDAAAHLGALAAGGRTTAVMAGGVDRLYPKANEDMLRQIAKLGAVVSELPPGSAPRRERFLDRNRLMAAMTSATVVVESAWRSGAHRTAHVAAELMRPVAAVPGPVTSAASAGCHRLVRDGVATLVADCAQLLDLVSKVGSQIEPLTDHPSGPLDGLSAPERRVYDALPQRQIARTSQVVVASGLAATQVIAALSRLERAGRVCGISGGWRRTAPNEPRRKES